MDCDIIVVEITKTDQIVTFIQAKLGCTQDTLIFYGSMDSMNSTECNIHKN